MVYVPATVINEFHFTVIYGEFSKLYAFDTTKTKDNSRYTTPSFVQLKKKIDKILFRYVIYE